TAGSAATTADIAASTDRNYVTDAQAAVISNTSGTNTGDQTLSGLGGVVANTSIVAGTATKVTFDAKGLVTGGSAATTADIAASTDRNYVTDAQAVIISNTSGSNTGDQTLSSLSGVPSNRNLTINGTTYDLSVDRTFAITNISGNAATVTTNADLNGEVTSVGNVTTVTNAAVIGKVLTGFVSGAGTVAATDNILQAIQKLDGNLTTGTGVMAGDVTGTSGANTVVKINGTSLSGLSTGILKNTTGTGVPSIAVASDFPILNQNTTGTASGVSGVVAVANGGTGSATQNFVDLTSVQNSIGGAKTWTSLGTFSAGLAAAGADVNLNASSNFNTNINTGTSTGAITIGNAVSTGITQQVGTGNFSLNGTTGSTYTIGSATTTGTVTIGGAAQSGAITLGQSTASNTINIGSANTAAANSQTVNIANGANAGTSSTVNILSGAGTSGTATLNLGSNPRVTTIDIGDVTPVAARTITIGGQTSAVVDQINIGTGAATVAGGKTINIGTTPPTGSGTNVVSIGAASTTNGNGIRFGNPRIVVNKPLAPPVINTATYLLTATQILDAGIIVVTRTNDCTLTLPTAALLAAAMPVTPVAGDVITFVIVNTNDTGTTTLAAGVGGTLVGPATIAQSRLNTGGGATYYPAPPRYVTIRFGSASAYSVY
ncbi:MAG: hypothetical protein WCP08_14770, partial [Prolixibacteraceae bacterium]